MSAEEAAAATDASGATIGLVLILASLALASPAVALARRIFPGRSVFFARWGFAHVAAVISMYFGGLFLWGGASQLLGYDAQGDALTLLAIESLVMLAPIATIVALAGRLDPDGWRSLGLRGGRTPRALAVGGVAYLVALPGLVGVMLAWSWLVARLGWEPAPQPILELAAQLSGARLAGFAVLAVVVAPLFEELFFRAFLQPLFVQNLGDRGGVVVTAALFALVHTNLVALVPIFVLALVLGFVMLRTQSLAAAWLVHALHNGGMLALLAFFPESVEHLSP